MALQILHIPLADAFIEIQFVNVSGVLFVLLFVFGAQDFPGRFLCLLGKALAEKV